MIDLGPKEKVELTKKKLTKLGILDGAVNANIPNADLSECVLYKHDFTGANLTDANLTGCSLTECTFDKSKIVNAKFDKTLIVDCSFQGVTGNGASFKHVTFQGACNLDKSDFSSVKGHNIATSFEYAQAGYNVSFSKCNLLGVTLNNARLAGVNFTGATLSTHKYGGVPMILRANLFRANMQGVVMQNMSMGDLDRIELADLSGSDLSGISFATMTLWGTNFSHCNLSGMYVVLNVIFAGAIMHFCNLADADLSQAISLETAKLEGSTYNKNTKWPQGFNPLKHGLKLR